MASMPNITCPRGDTSSPAALHSDAPKATGENMNQEQKKRNVMSFGISNSAALAPKWACGQR